MRPWALQPLQPSLCPGHEASGAAPVASQPLLVQNEVAARGTGTLAPASCSTREEGEDLEEAGNPFREGTGSLSLSSKTQGCFSRGWPAGRSSGYSPDGGSNNHSMTTASIPTPTPCPKSEEEPRRAGAEASRVSPGGVSGPGGWGLIAGTVSVCEAAPCRGRLWFSTRPQQENGSRGAVGASFLGALQRRQPKVRAGSGPWLGE